MAGDPAIVKISAALVALAETPGLKVFADRSDEEPIQEEERPAIVLRTVDIQFQPNGQGEMRHAATIDFDFYEEAMASTGITARLAVMIAGFNARVAADRTLGGRAESFELRSATAELDAVPDLGVAAVTADLTFLTPRDDFTTILGASGQF